MVPSSIPDRPAAASWPLLLPVRLLGDAADSAQWTGHALNRFGKPGGPQRAKDDISVEATVLSLSFSFQVELIANLFYI